MTDLAAAALAWVRHPSTVDYTLRQLAVLAIVCAEDGPIHHRTITMRLQVSKPVVTRALNLLERDGLVRRMRGIRDKRDILVAPTPEGLVFRDAIARVSSRTTGDFDPAELLAAASAPIELARVENGELPHPTLTDRLLRLVVQRHPYGGNALERALREMMFLAWSGRHFFQPLSSGEAAAHPVAAALPFPVTESNSEKAHV